jgi:hypothetical protein
VRKAILGESRLTLFLSVLGLVPHANKILKAQQFINACQTFTPASSEPCPSCCTTSGEVSQVPSSTGPGTDGLVATNWSCGTQRAGRGYSCSGTTYVTQDDSACCLTTGQACSTTAQCCGSPGDSCEGGTCTASCLPVGSNCSTDDGCCGSLACDGGVCTNEGGGGGGGGGGDPGCCFDAIPVKSLSLSKSAAVIVSPLDDCDDDEVVTITVAGKNAILVLPAADGLIHDSKQLFGSSSPQPATASPTGLAALAMYDLPTNGGNGDGVIDSRDAIYSHLRVWIDANHDGISQPLELHMLASLGVASISLNRALGKTEGRSLVLQTSGTPHITGRVKLSTAGSLR